MIKKLMSVTAALVIAITNIGTMKAMAKVIQPEIVKTEKWTTSYWIDDDKDTFYPYIDCEADIYNDGTIRVYAWNTHEWDGFTTVEHTASFIEAEPLPYSEYQKIKNKIKDYGCNFYPEDYKCSTYGFCQPFGEINVFYQEYSDYVYSRMFKGALPKMDFYSERPDYSRGIVLDYGAMTFTPKIEPIKTYDFKIYGHDITITPELLQTTQFPESPVVDDTNSLKSRIAELEAENANLKTELKTVNERLTNASILIDQATNGDVNGDGTTNAVDASVILGYYAYLSTGGTLSLRNYMLEEGII